MEVRVTSVELITVARVIRAPEGARMLNDSSRSRVIVLVFPKWPAGGSSRHDLTRLAHAKTKRRIARIIVGI